MIVLTAPFAGNPGERKPRRSADPPAGRPRIRAAGRGMVAGLFNPTLAGLATGGNRGVIATAPGSTPRPSAPSAWLIIVLVDLCLRLGASRRHVRAGGVDVAETVLRPEQGELRRQVLAIFLPLGLFVRGPGGRLLLAESRPRLATGLGRRRPLRGAGRWSRLPLGYVAGLSLLAEKLPGWFVQTVASAGRMALTVYLSETVIATMLSYYWGFALVRPGQPLASSW